MANKAYEICVVTLWKECPGGKRFFGQEIPVGSLTEGFDMLEGLRVKEKAVVEVFDGKSLIFTFHDEGYDFPVDDNVYRTESVEGKDGIGAYITVEFPLDED